MSIAKAVALYESFRERKPKRIGKVSLTVPKAVACIGYVEAIDYRTTHGKKVTLYTHDFAPGSRPLLAVSGDGKQLLLLGGRYEFTERGIVDKDAAGRDVENAGHGKTINPRGGLKQKDVFAQIRAMGLTVKRDEVGEFRVTDPKLSKARQEDIAYYTDDLGDLLSTAGHMAKNRVTNSRESRSEYDANLQSVETPKPAKDSTPGDYFTHAEKKSPPKKVKNPRSDAEVIKAVTTRELAVFAGMRKGTHKATDIPPRLPAEVDAFRRYQRALANLGRQVNPVTTRQHFDAWCRNQQVKPAVRKIMWANYLSDPDFWSDKDWPRRYQRALANPVTTRQHFDAWCKNQQVKPAVRKIMWANYLGDPDFWSDKGWPRLLQFTETGA